MNSSPGLALLDWLILGAYLVLALAVGLAVKSRAEEGRESYFLADRSLPWWWAGASIAATTFAADTPLAVTGIIAGRGLSGNWMWLSWMGVHAAVVVLFAAKWRSSRVITDAELVELRYSGAAAGYLRTFRAALFGVVFNCIVLGWVLKAMVKIAGPFFRWDDWLPSLLGALQTVWPTGTMLGTPSDGLTILLLLGIVAVYSGFGGIRGVIFTDLIQLAIALFGSVWLAAAAWSEVGGQAGLVRGLAELYGPDHAYLDLFPHRGGWVSAVGMGAFSFGLYLIVQSYANVPADGGGYLMQRLNSTKSSAHAQKASLLFVVIQYGVRVWPWFVVALAALVLFPLGGQSPGSTSELAQVVAADREAAYPALIHRLLPPGVLGLMVTSLLAAFMSTVDTHLNWGASYVVNDVYVRLRPDASERDQVRVARWSVIGFVALAVFACLQIDTIEQAWQWVAALGAALGAPTALRWIYWRVTAASELVSAGCGLGVAVILSVATDLSYETRLVYIALASLLGLAATIAVRWNDTPAPPSRFMELVEPSGFWPGVQTVPAATGLAIHALEWSVVVGSLIALLVAGQRGLLFGEMKTAIVCFAVGSIGIGWCWSRIRSE